MSEPKTEAMDPPADPISDLIKDKCDFEIEKLNEELNETKKSYDALNERITTGTAKLTEVSKSYDIEYAKKGYYRCEATLSYLWARLRKLDRLYGNNGKIIMQKYDMESEIESIEEKIKYYENQKQYYLKARQYIESIFDESKNDTLTGNFYADILRTVYDVYISEHTEVKYDPGVCPIESILECKGSTYNLLIGYANMIHFFIKFNDIHEQMSSKKKISFRRFKVSTFPAHIFEYFELPETETINSNSKCVIMIVGREKWFRKHYFGDEENYAYNIKYVAIHSPYHYNEEFNISSDKLNVNGFESHECHEVFSLLSLPEGPYGDRDLLCVDYDDIIYEYDSLPGVKEYNDD